MEGGFKTKKEEQIAAKEKETQIESGFEQKPLTLNHFLTDWLLEYKKGNVRKILLIYMKLISATTYFHILKMY